MHTGETFLVFSSRRRRDVATSTPVRSITRLADLLVQRYPVAQVSAHRCGAGADIDLENSLPAIETAVASECDYIEFDVQRTRDGVFVLYHSDFVGVDGQERSIAEMNYKEFAALAPLKFTTLEQCLERLKGQKKAHVDLKFTSPAKLYADPESTYEVQAAQQILQELGEGNFIITSLEDESIQAVRAWSKRHCPSLLVGLSLGRSLSGRPWWERLSGLHNDIFPRRRFEQTDSNLMVVHRTFARLYLANWARRHDLPLLVWTVDGEGSLAYWFAPGRAWMVTSNRLDRAVYAHKRSQWLLDTLRREALTSLSEQSVRERLRQLASTYRQIEFS
jgi:glycerophosphoryl diester phosphodiesterase